jgi:hypothetical protein
MSLYQNASSWAQGGLLFMRQKRFQKGCVRPRKHGKNKVWVAQWWEDGRKKSKVLGRCTMMGKSEAEAAMVVILKPQNEDAGQTQKPVYTFGVYLEQVFLPMHHARSDADVPGQESRDTLARYSGTPPVGPQQRFQDGPRRRSGGLESSSGALHSAMQAGVEKRVMSPEEIRVALGVLGPRERLIFRMAVFDGMRPGETLAIRIGNISGESVLIDQRA